MIILSIISLLLLGVALYFLKRKLVLLLIPLVLALIIGASLKLMYGFLPFPIGVRHLMHLFISPTDLYEPIVTDNFLFFQRNYSKTYSLKPKYFDFYDGGVFYK